WTFQHGYSSGSPPDIYNKKVIDRINKAAGGRLKIEFFAGGAVVPATEEADGLRTGTLDFANIYGGYNMHLNPATSFADGMAGGLSIVQLKYWMETGGGNELFTELYEPFGITWIGDHLWSPEDFAYTSFPLNTVEDIKKLKMRTAGPGGEILARMGASTVFLPGGELYESMQRGVINAFEYGGAAEAWEMGFQEVMDYLYISLTRAPSDAGGFMARTESWEALPDDLKTIVMYISRGAADELWGYYMVMNAEAIVKIGEYGVTVEKLPKEIEEAFVSEAEGFFDEKAAKEGGIYARIVESVRVFKKIAELQGVY
ncbi:MAG: TRAP transporter substrate-binding protein DctP, partial [Anaerolineales bacterium]|nr:TRAP transporter substrate-binding protein DctP [Anaerolineales bacterium]